MKSIALDDNWTFRRGLLDNIGMLRSDPGVKISLPHDGMIGTPVTPDAPAQMDMGYFTGDICNYTKYVKIPKEWEGDCIGLYFDGAMMNATVDVNGCKASQQHYGYAPFYVDLTDLVTFGEENRITVNVNTSMQPNSRWYTGSGLYRGVKLMHGPRVHIAHDGIFVYTKEVTEDYAYLEARVDIVNRSPENRLAEVELIFERDEAKTCAKRVIHVGHGSTETARIAVTIPDPVLWDADHPELYKVTARVVDKGVYRTHFLPQEEGCSDEAETLFGIRTITADAVRGLRINGRTVKLRGGCLHHDNGLLGAVSLYETEARKVRKLKEVGFNAIRTTHNPPSAALIEACDRIGMYIFDEAFDAWGIAKRGGDYNQFFDDNWEKDLSAFVRRDRTHPCVIMWSTGNEIPERGGLDNGYTLATRLAETVRSLDGTRPVSNGVCSFWSGLDDHLAASQDLQQNAAGDGAEDLWEKGTEPFTNGLDIVGYNYMEDLYERDHEMFPERVILGSENFPKEIGFRWPMVERLPYVIGDFTWTAWDYLGEAGIGKAVYVDKDDPLADKGPWALMPQGTSPFPWRTANDADYDITGYRLPQGAYRSVVWGNKDTFLYSQHPEHFGKVEMLSPWGFPELLSCWNYKEHEGKPAELVVFSCAQEVEVFVNGKSIGRKTVSSDRPMPCSVRFETEYHAGKVEAVSYTDGKEVSRAVLETTGEMAAIRLVPEKHEMRADGHDLVYVGIEVIDPEGRVVPDAAIRLKAAVCSDDRKDPDGDRSGCPAYLAGFGSGNPVTEEDYTDDETVTFRGRALAILRSGYDEGNVTLTVSSGEMKEAQVSLSVR